MQRVILSFVISVMSFTANAAILKSNSAWAYDAYFDPTTQKTIIIPGMFADNLRQYNLTAEAGHKITRVYSYGGYMKMFCRGSGGSSPNTPCTAANMTVTYMKKSTDAYLSRVSTSDNPVTIMPVVDGVTTGLNLTAFNTLDRATAWIYADKVAKLYCSDDTIDGIEFDIEPFDNLAAGQLYFYDQIAKNFAGRHYQFKEDPYHCVDAKHPTGRIFGVFVTSRRIDANVVKFLTKYKNGFIVGALYTLGPASLEANSPSLYAYYIVNEVKRMVKLGNTYGVNYQFGIPASATIEEFEAINGIPSGYSQLDYVTIAINTIDQYARNDPHFLGSSLWVWAGERSRRQSVYLPILPPVTVLKYLGQKL